ncbi:hypothetical protein [Rhodococcus gannanensis]|uniref:Uncharacterized protein n=1 Tax=Rhodococcus gannanensis TaxID=1960308 RepID=A0ABW4P8Y4_9NOCA
MTTIDPAASDTSFGELQRDPFFGVATDLIVDCLNDAFDDPAGGEVDRWTLSALPSTNHAADRHRMFTLAVGPTDVLYVERFLEDGEIVDYRVVLALSASVLTDRTGIAPGGLSARFPLLRFTPTTTGGDDVLVDWFVSDAGADDQFFDLPLAEAIRALADDLASHGRGPYAQQHNRAFAAHVLSRASDDE